MGPGARIRGGVLSTVVVVAVLMLLVVLAVIALWEADFLLFSRANHLRVQRAHIRSAFTLYCNHPDIAERLDADSTLVLYDSVPGSRVRIAREPWGLYEAVTVGTAGGAVSSAIVGVREPREPHGVLWYRDGGMALTLTGKTDIRGTVHAPEKGVIYGQMQSTFFSGERLNPNDIRRSDERMPRGSAAAGAVVESLFGLLGSGAAAMPDSITVPFRDGVTEVVAAPTMIDSYLSGRVIVVGDKVTIGPDAALHDVVVVAREIRVRDGFRGSAQFFARDSAIVGEQVVLEYPSGVYSERYASLGDHSEVNGYMIVDSGAGDDIMQPACRKSRLSRVRGLFYCSGTAVVQGIVSGAAYIDRVVYYSPQGYYSALLYDAALIDSRETAFPLWFDGPPRRKEAKWVR